MAMAALINFGRGAIKRRSYECDVCIDADTRVDIFHRTPTRSCICYIYSRRVAYVSARRRLHVNGGAALSMYGRKVAVSIYLDSR